MRLLKSLEPSPDGSGILFIFFSKIKRYSEQQENAPTLLKQILIEHHSDGIGVAAFGPCVTSSGRSGIGFQ